MDALRQVLHVVHEDAVAQGHQVLRVHQENSLIAKELASELHSSLRSLAETDVAKLSQQMANVDVALVSSLLSIQLTGPMLTKSGMAYKPANGCARARK